MEQIINDKMNDWQPTSNTHQHSSKRHTSKSTFSFKNIFLLIQNIFASIVKI